MEGRKQSEGAVVEREVDATKDNLAGQIKGLWYGLLKRCWGDCRQVIHLWKLIIVAWLQKSLLKLQPSHAHNQFQSFSTGQSAVCLLRKHKHTWRRKALPTTRDTWTQYQCENREELRDFTGLVGSKTVWLRNGSKRPYLRGRGNRKSRDRPGKGSERKPLVLLVLWDAVKQYHGTYFWWGTPEGLLKFTLW